MGGGDLEHTRKRRDTGRGTQHVAARSLQRPQIRLDQGQRKEGQPQFPRQIRHMSTRFGERGSCFRMQRVQQPGDPVATLARQ
jgi:hypothetical protein